MNKGYKTAMSRKAPSVVAKYVMKKYNPRSRLLDYGCGKGFDLSCYVKHGFDASGYDPHFLPIRPDGVFDVITCSYVLNVLEPTARDSVLSDIFRLLRPGGKALFTLRGDVEASRSPSWVPKLDGYVLPSGAFQADISRDLICRLLSRNGFDYVRSWIDNGSTWATAGRKLGIVF